MSIHAQLSPEVLEALRKDKRKSSMLSALASVLFILLLGLILTLIFLDEIIQETPTIVTYAADVREESPEVRPQVKVPQRKPAATSSAQSKVIAAAMSSPTAIPVPEIDMTTPSQNFGDMDDFGTGFGDDFGTQGGLDGIPAALSKRCSPQDRLARLRETGGTPECEEAVEKALEWLQSTQNPDGSWESSNQAAMTGLALLAYLGRCETPASAKYGGNVVTGIVYLIDVAKKNEGRLSVNSSTSNAWVYEHGIATYALAEAYTFCKQLGINIPDLEETVLKAGNMILEGQRSNGSWVYRYGSSGQGDNSLGFWQIQALKACQYTGLWEDEVIAAAGKKSVDWLKSVQGSNGAIGYRNRWSRSPGLTGGGVFCIQLWEGSSSPAAIKGVEYLAENVTRFDWSDSSSNVYYNYYNAMALINHGGLPWQKFNELFREEVLRNQQPDGSWTRRRHNHDAINRHMATCLTAMMLEAYYRFLPATGAAR